MCSTQVAATRALLMTVATTTLVTVSADGSTSGSGSVAIISSEQPPGLTLLITGAVGLALCAVFSVVSFGIGVVMRMVDPDGKQALFFLISCVDAKMGDKCFFL